MINRLKKKDTQLLHVKWETPTWARCWLVPGIAEQWRDFLISKGVEIIGMETAGETPQSLPHLTIELNVIFLGSEEQMKQLISEFKWFTD